MTRFGTNMKLTIATQWRPRVRALFVDVLGASALQPTEDLEVYRLDDGGNVGVYYVDASEALSPEDQQKGAWLEFRVDDPDVTNRKVRASGVAQIEHPHDREHAYFQVPGGPVFRLARSG